MAPQVGLLEVVDQFVDLVDVIAVQGAIGGVGAGAMDLEATAAGLGRGALACIEETHSRLRGVEVSGNLVLRDASWRL